MIAIEVQLCFSVVFEGYKICNGYKRNLLRLQEKSVTRCNATPW